MICDWCDAKFKRADRKQRFCPRCEARLRELIREGIDAGVAAGLEYKYRRFALELALFHEPGKAVRNAGSMARDAEKEAERWDKTPGVWELYRWHYHRAWPVSDDDD